MRRRFTAAGRGRRSRAVLALALVVGALAAATIAPGVQANHSWGNYHWARNTSSFTLKVGDNLTTQTWKDVMTTAVGEWSTSTKLDLAKVAGSAGTKQCRPPSGRVEVCNATYGYNGWLGIASISVTGSHIVQGYVKLNDSYFNTNSYNTTPWRRLVMCQEIGHTFGLDHQDETFDNANLGTCMDYTNDPDGGGAYGPSNVSPNQHDYDQLVTIYSHTDGSNSYASSGFGGALALVVSIANGHEADPEWGELVSVSRDGHQSLYARPTGPGSWLLTHVTWAEERVPR